MAAYYAQRPPSSNPRPSASRENGEGAERERANLTSLNVISPDHSIYIFPSPPSAPPSPYPASPGSSLFSPSTDFDASEPFSLGVRSRASSSAPSTAASASPAGGDVALTRRQAAPLGDDELEIDVELWELSTDPTVDISESDSSWVLEDEIDRVGAGDVDFSYMNVRRNHRLISPRSSDVPPYWTMRRRSRTHSRIRTISSLSSPLSSTSARRPAPHPRIHIPLLSFFSSLLSIDIDDPALRLLTHADPGESESILFPGHTTAQLLTSDDAQSRERDNESDASTDVDSTGSHPEEEEQPHGLPKLLLATISDQSTVALRSLRAGLAVYIPHSPDVALPFTRPSELFGLWRVVGEVCARSSQAWKEVWGARRADWDDVVRD
ncbi:hypothetical protein L226DRAFT_532625 [Lentinus tigrinus ALCF2SS1-7]|uniref:Uncharacterized protein n=1 Tax=Lentinus tigrinus ALCF2SS1-6 TaxID=1328759 RepID=A0A5C2SEW9_9APHY|nr:hypothetical protein L227DRAFT_573562 [Lentinus tigrinus ALCF2SS1-6]RPD77859.1 hypothetical protein L226DRAFT_532625 [Lentinus tigrinus ALCF2SS1-7]